MIRALVVTWTSLVAPRAAAGRLAALSPWAVVGVVLLHASTAGLLAAGTWWITQTRTTVWILTPVTVPAAGPTTGLTTRPMPPGVWTMPTPRLRQRSLAEVWRDAHAGVWFGPMESIAVGCAATLVGLTLALAWVFLSCVHRDGSLRSAGWRALAAAGPGSIVLMLAVMFVLAGILADFVDVLRWNNTSLYSARDMVFWFAPCWLLLTVVCTARAAASIGRTLPVEAAPPLCEHCGYNLTGHNSSAGRCPECGHSLADSLAPDHRAGPPWESKMRSGQIPWIRTTFEVLLTPGHFYRRLPVRRDVGQALLFEATNVAGVILCVLITLFVLASGLQSDPDLEDLALVGFGSTGSGLLAWTGHRALATLITTRWLLRGAVRDGWAAARVAAYESAFIWPFVLWFVGLGLSFSRFGPWISALIDPSLAAGKGTLPVLGAPIDLWVFAGGLGGLTVVWMMRYSIALRAVRWANA